MSIRTFSDRHPVAFCIAVIDSVIIISAAELAHLWRFGDLIGKGDYLWVSCSLALLVVLSSVFSGLYESWRGRSGGLMLKSMCWAWSIPFIMLLIVLVFTKQAQEFSRFWIGTWLLLSLVGGGGFRIALYYFFAVARANTRNTKSVLVIGDRGQYQKAKEYFQTKPTFGYRLSGYLTLESDIKLSALDKNALLDQLDSVKPHEIWLCLPLKQAALIDPILYTLRHSTAEIRFVPQMQDMALLNHQSRYIGDYLTLDLSCSPLSGAAHWIKRLEDLLIGSFIFILILPLCLLIALAVKWSSPGPVLFKQFRDGVHGRKINVYKFRTMLVHQESGGAVTQASKGDRRVTKVGAFLRRTSLDELPQFYNVIQGRMSIVGPRPHAVAHNDYYKDLVDSYMWRHKVKPGITGWAQVNGFRGETDTLQKMQGRVKRDLWYIDNWSFWLDLKIIALTIYKGFINDNAY